jgi:beta-lactamase regulating signal transducer with metallopeptidase domain
MTMSDFMRTLISMSLSGTIVAVVLVALKPLVTKRLSRTWQYYVWLIVLLRLLLPLSPTITITGNVLPGTTYTNMSPVVTSAPVTTTPAGTTPATSTPTGQPATPKQTTPHTTPADANGGAARSVSALLLMIWAIGASAVMVYNIAGYERFKRMVRRTAVRVTDSRLLTILEACRQETHVRVSPALYTSTLVTSPILVGVIHPAIVLPDRLSTDNELRYALLHELTHARCQDALLKWATVIATSIHWLNPLAYVVQREMDRSCELACDEAVTMKFSADDRRGYGSMLLAVASAAGAPSPAMFSAMVEEKRNLKERLGTIMASKKQTKRTMVVSVVAAFFITGIALLAGCTFTAKQSGMQQPAALSQIRMITQKTGWALTKDNQILKTADGGATWANVSIPALLQTQASWKSLPTSACFVDEQTAFVAAPSGPASEPHGIVYRTGDEGKTWSSVQLPSGTSWERYDINGLLVDFPDASHGYIMTTSSPGLGQMLKALYKTDDGGKSYSFAKEITGFTDVQGKFSGIEGYPTGMAFSSATTGFVTCTYHGQENPQIYKTTDGGLTWGLALQQLPTSGSTYALSFPQGEVPNDNGENGYINGYSPLFIGTKRTDGLMLLDRRNGEATSLQVYRTHDGGATWAPAELMENKSIHTCSFIDSRNGYGLDDTGKLFATSDGGLHWTAVTTGSPQASVHWPTDGLYVADWYGYTGITEGEQGIAVDIPCVLVHTVKGSSTNLPTVYSLALASTNKSITELASFDWVRGDENNKCTFYTLHIGLPQLTAGSYNVTSLQLQTADASTTDLQTADALTTYYRLNWIVDVKKIAAPMIVVTGQSSLGGPHTGQFSAQLKNVSQHTVTIKGLLFRLADRSFTVSTGALSPDPFDTKNTTPSNGLGSTISDSTPQPEPTPLTNPEAYTILPGQKKAYVFETVLTTRQELPLFESIRPFVQYSDGTSDGLAEFMNPQIFSAFPRTDQEIVDLLNTQFQTGTGTENK